MVWTESGTRDEWLTEVRRRGEGIRRRRRVTVALVGALALVLPVSGVAGFLSGMSNRAGVELEVAGPPAPRVTLAVDSGEPGLTPPGEPGGSVEPEPPMATTIPLAVPPLGGGTLPDGTLPAPPTSIKTMDEPVVRTTTTIALLGNSSDPVQSPAGPTPLGAGTAAARSALAPCVAADVRLTLSVERTTYAPGETVQASSVLEKVSPGTCELPSSGISIGVFDAAGRDLSHLGYGVWLLSSTQNQSDRTTCDMGSCRRPVDPGPIFTYHLEWNTGFCPPQSGPFVPAPGIRCPTPTPGTYTVVSEWSGPGSGPPARTTIQFTA